MGLLQLAAVRAVGTGFPAEISLAPIDVADVRMTVATVRDLASRRSLEQEADRLRDQLLATATHELRTPRTSSAVRPPRCARRARGPP